MSAVKAEVLAMLADGLSQREVNRRTGVSRKTLWRWAGDVPKPDAAPRRHFVIPDRQMKAGVPLEYNVWIGKSIRDYKPDAVIDIGDNSDLPSMSSYNPLGSKAREGQRLKNDIDASNEGERLLNKGMGNFRPKERYRFRGNHENRLLRYIEANPVLDGLIGLEMLDDEGWEIIPYSNGSPGIKVIDGVSYAHFFANPMTGKPISGTITNRLAKIGCSFVQGHQQGLLQGNVQYANGQIRHGISAGSCYLHDEDFKGAANAHWRGVIVLNEVRDGQFCEMPLTLDYLCRKYEHMSVARYLREHYENAEQRFTLAREAA